MSSLSLSADGLDALTDDAAVSSPSSYENTCSLMEQDRPAIFFAATIRFAVTSAAAVPSSLLFMELPESLLDLLLVVSFFVEGDVEDRATEISSTIRANPKSQIF